jgi:hypothetical protein
MRFAAIALALIPIGSSATPATDHPIDRHLEELWSRSGVTAAPPATDAEFLRRVSLDLTGRIPDADDARAFAADADAGKRARKIEALLASPAFLDFWAERLTAAFLGYPRAYETAVNRAGFLAWIRRHLEEFSGYDYVVRKLLTASGTPAQAPEVSFLSQFLGEAGLKIEELTGKTSSIFLGVRISCAQCHDHPTDRWKQDDFYGLLAFFRRLQAGEEYGLTDGEEVAYTFERYTKKLAPRFLDGRGAGSDRLREEFARLLTSSPQFARATVNRFWAYFFGRGLVDPYDDFSRPCVSEPLLDELATEFAKRRFNLRWLLRTIVTSRAYQRSSSGEKSGEKLFARASIRPLSPEQLFDAIADATELRKADVNTKAMMRLRREFAMIGEVDTYRLVRRWFIGLLVRTSSPDAPEALASYTANTQQVLHTMNLDSPVFAGAKVDADGRLDRILDRFGRPERVIEELYWTTLSRPPTAREIEVCLAHCQDRKESPKAFEEIFWALLNADEFIFNH